MRLHSKFQDYYDTALGYGIDELCHYSRQTEEFGVLAQTVENPYNTHLPWFDNDGEAVVNDTSCMYHLGYGRRLHTGIQSISGYLVAFCGKMYFGMRVDCYSNDPHKNAGPFFIWNINDLDRMIEDDYFDKDIKELYFTKRKKKKDRFSNGLSLTTFHHGIKTLPVKSLLNRSRMVKVFDQWEKRDNTRLVELHHETGIPIIMRDFRDNKIIFNPVLKDIGFYKAVDAFTAFQELSMFISGVMGGNSPKMVQLDDDMRIAKHGFDKMSFRKEKEDK